MKSKLNNSIVDELTETTDESEDVPTEELTTADRLDRLDEETTGFEGLWKMGMAGWLIAIGAVLTITVIGAVIGIPMILFGIGLLFKGGYDGVKSDASPWEGTRLGESYEGGHVARSGERTANKQLGGGCPMCGEFAGLRNGSPVRCVACDSALKKEIGGKKYRVIESPVSPEEVGVSKPVAEWVDQFRHRALSAE